MSSVGTRVENVQLPLSPSGKPVPTLNFDLQFFPSMPTKPRKAPERKVLRDFFGSLDVRTKNLLLLSLNLETDSDHFQKGRQEKLEA